MLKLLLFKFYLNTNFEQTKIAANVDVHAKEKSNITSMFKSQLAEVRNTLDEMAKEKAQLQADFDRLAQEKVNLQLSANECGKKLRTTEEFEQGFHKMAATNEDLKNEIVKLKVELDKLQEDVRGEKVANAEKQQTIETLRNQLKFNKKIHEQENLLRR